MLYSVSDNSRKAHKLNGKEMFAQMTKKQISDFAAWH